MGPDMIRSIIREELGQMGGGGGGAQKAAPKAKVDPAQLLTEVVRTRKLLTHLMSSANISLPADILDEPEGASPEQQQGSGQQANSPSQQTPEHKSAIAPLTAMEGASPMPKAAGENSVVNHAGALLQILRVSVGGWDADRKTG
jgi:hypothetical protein